MYVCMYVCTYIRKCVCVYPRMDKKGGGNDVIYPDIMFCVDGFEEVYCSADINSPISYRVEFLLRANIFLLIKGGTVPWCLESLKM